MEDKKLSSLQLHLANGGTRANFEIKECKKDPSLEAAADKIANAMCANIKSHKPEDGVTVTENKPRKKVNCGTPLIWALEKEQEEREALERQSESARECENASKVSATSKSDDIIPAADILTAVCILANKGALKLFEKTLEELKATSGVTIGMEELLDLAGAGCESTDDAALVNAVSDAISADS